jgi:orotidine-5'-phosphate decarboxylase
VQLPARRSVVQLFVSDSTTAQAGSDHPARSRLAFALDYPTLDEARRGARLVRDSVGVLKVGLELFVREGPNAIALGAELGCDVFLDLKLHDIPETVERAVASAAAHGVRYLTVHASGGPAMLARAAASAQGSNLTLLAVTVLTSLDEHDLARLGIQGSPSLVAQRLSQLGWQQGVKGFVCSAAEVKSLRQILGPEAVLVTPGIRPLGPGGDDQKRVGTPEGAIRHGSSLLVVGRPIRDAADPASAARGLADAIAEASRE